MAKRPPLVLLALTAAVLLVLTGCTGGGGGAASTNGAASGTLTIGAQLDNTTFDTAAIEVGNRVQYWQPVYDTLIYLDPAGQPKPNLATKWSYNADNTVLTLTLRDDVTFTDGTKFDGDAVKANIKHLKGGGGSVAYMVAGISNVVVDSPTRVELHLAAPNPALVSYLGQAGGAMASPTAIAAGTLAEKPVGSGPYTYDAADSVKGTSYVYTRNEGYWNKGAYPFDKVIVKPITDPTPRLNALKTGQIDAGFLNPALAAEARGSGITIEQLPVNWAGFVIADRAGKIVPQLADPRVRQAINYAIDKEGIVKSILLGYGVSTSQVFNKKSQAFDPDIDGQYSYNVAKAKELLAEAGVGHFSIRIPQPTGNFTALGPVLQQELAAVGITLEYDQVPVDQGIAVALSGKYPMFFTPLASGSAWQDIQTWVTPTAPWNPLKSTDPKLEALIAAAQTAKPADQDAAFQAVNKWLVDNAWFAPFFTPDNVFGTTARVSTTMQAQNSVPSLRSYKPTGN